MADKQSAPLNGAFYGPSIPPPQRHYHRQGRGSGCGCCGCLFSLLLKLIFSVVIIIGVAILVFWLVVHPHKVKFHVTDATLTEFNLNQSSTNTLYYNLSLNIAVRNPNKKIGIYYDKLEARAIYEGQRFDVDFLDPFYQGHKNTSVLSPSFSGQHVMVLSNNALTEYNNEKAAGSYDIEVKLYLKIRFKVGKFKTGKFKPRVTCRFKIPVNGTGGAISVIGSKCDMDLHN